MRRIVWEDHPFRRRVVGADEARELFADQPYKLETIAGLEKGREEYGEARYDGAVISTYAQDAFEDLCLGPHLGRIGEIPPDGFKILDVSGAYWRGSEYCWARPVAGSVWNRTRPSYLGWALLYSRTFEAARQMPTPAGILGRISRSGVAMAEWLVVVVLQEGRA